MRAQCNNAIGLAGALLLLGLTVPALAQPADTIRVGAWDFPSGRGNPFSGVPGIPQVYIWSAVFDTLTYVNEKGSPVGGLAVSWKNINPTTWQFVLRDNVTFHNGEKLEADAVVKTLDWFKTEPGKASVAGATFNYIASATAVDAKTVELVTTGPRPIFPNQVAALYVVPPKAWAEMGVEQFSAKPVGTGPYRPVEWTGEQIRTESFPAAFRSPKTPKLTYTRLLEGVARRQALVSNQIDIMIQATTEDIPVLKAAGATVDVVPSPLTLQLGLVLENPSPGVDITPLRDKRVRLALNLAIDKEAINKNLMGGIMGINTQYSVPTAFGYNPSIKAFPYDPAKAKQLMTEAGYPNGFRMKAEIRESFDAFQQVAQDLGKIGVTLEMTPIVHADWVRKFLQVKWDGQAFSLTLGVAPEIDTVRMMLFQSCRKNPAYYCNQDMMPLINASDAEFDPARREKILQELMVKMTEDVPALFLFELQDINAYGRRVRGFKNINRVFNYHEVTLAN